MEPIDLFIEGQLHRGDLSMNYSPPPGNVRFIRQINRLTCHICWKHWKLGLSSEKSMLIQGVP